MPSNVFVNLPVKDLSRSKAFFEKLGYAFNPQFTDANAACMVIDTNIFAMLLVEPYFATFIDRPISDAHRAKEVLVALSLDSKAAVTQIVETALSAGARRFREPVDHGFMFQWAFEDLDGHVWEYVWMDAAHVQG